jgi:hypothetical protein
MDREIERNSEKGDWGKWDPHPIEWFWEIQYHLGKLQIAIKEGEHDEIREYSADVANYCEKAFSLYGDEKDEE